MKTTTSLLLGILLVGSIGCENSSDTGESGRLDGTQWRLTAWTFDSLSPADFTITATFAGGQVSGNSGVNSYGGPYDLGPGTGFSAGPLAGTLMAGSEAAMRAESAYLSLLSQAKSYRLSDGKLTLYDEGGSESLVFEVWVTGTIP